MKPLLLAVLLFMTGVAAWNRVSKEDWEARLADVDKAQKNLACRLWNYGTLDSCKKLFSMAFEDAECARKAVCDRESGLCEAEVAEGLACPDEPTDWKGLKASYLDYVASKPVDSCADDVADVRDACWARVLQVLEHADYFRAAGDL